MINWANLKLINYWHNKLNEVCFKVSDENDKRIYLKEKYISYFYIYKPDLEKAKEVLKDFVFTDIYSGNSTKVNFRFVEEEKYIKIYYDDTNNVYLKGLIKNIQSVLQTNNIKNLELDLLPGNLYLLDNSNIKIADEYNILYWDIETDDRNGDISIGRDRIVSICAIDNNGNKFKICYDDEKRILEEFIKLLGNYDMIVSWNGYKFDEPYIKARLLKNSIYFSFKSIISIDLMKVFMSSFAVSHSAGKRYLESYALNNIAKEFLHDSKLDIEDEGVMYGGKIWKLFTENRDKLLRYNLQDCVLMKNLNEKFNLLQNEIEIAKYAKFPLSKTRSASSIVDLVLLRECRKRNIHWKTTEYVLDKPHQEGGEVLDTVYGIHDNINIYDFKSMYPSIFRVGNISPDTVLDNREEDCITLPNGISFTKKFVGIVPSVLDELTELRFKYKAQKVKLKELGKKDEAYFMEFKETAIKVIILSIYGISGAIFSRFFDIRVANSITETGQYLLKNISKALNDAGFLVVFGDTDSVGFKLNDENKRTESELIIKDTINKIVESINTNRDNTLEMVHEKVLKKFILLLKTENVGAKKKYVGRCIWDDGNIMDDLYYRGIELHKASEIQITKRFLEEVVRKILWFEDDIKNFDINIIKDLILKYKKQILNKKVKAEDITIIKKVGRAINEYKNIPVHVKLAEKKSKNGEFFFVGQRVPYIVVSNNPLTIIHKNEFNGEYDAEYYWTRQVFPPTYRVLKTIFPKYNWTKYAEGTKDMQKGLDDFGITKNNYHNITV